MDGRNASTPADTLYASRVAKPNGAEAAGQTGLDIPALELKRSAAVAPAEWPHASNPAAVADHERAGPGTLPATEQDAPTGTPAAPARHAPEGERATPIPRVGPDELAHPGDGPRSAPAAGQQGDEAGSGPTADADAPPEGVASASGLPPHEVGGEDSDEPRERRFLDLMGKIVSESASTPSGTGAKLSASFGGGQGDVLARLIILSRKLPGAENAPGLYHQAFLAASLFKANRGNAAPVAMVLDDIDFSTSRNTPIYTVMRGLVLSVSCLCGVALALFAASSFVYARSNGMAWHDALVGPYLKALTSPLLIAVTFGMLGSVVSILLRLSEFEGATRRSRQFLKMTGAMLPLVGAVFASVTCALFASGIINFNFAADPGSPAKALSNPYFYVVVGFLSGFSERFTRGLLGTAEKALSSTTRVQAENITTRDGTATVVTEVKKTVSGNGGQG